MEPTVPPEAVVVVAVEKVVVAIPPLHPSERDSLIGREGGEGRVPVREADGVARAPTVLTVAQWRLSLRLRDPVRVVPVETAVPRAERGREG